MASILIRLIKLYQRIRPVVLPKTCRFYPSCSQYAKEAIEQFGLCGGIVRALYRVFRCSPLYRGGYDPVIRK